MDVVIKDAESKKRPTLILARFDSAKAVMHAAEKVRDAGYVRWETHTPFPVHGMDKAMGLSDSRLGWIVITGALTGLATAFTMMYWMNGVDYRIVIGGKPPETVPSMVPIMFELTILFSAFSAVFGMFGMNKLPRHNHPVFESETFRSATNDRFFISIETDDPKFDTKRTRTLLESAHASNVELIEEEV